MSGVDPPDLLERGSREHYDDAQYYDQTYRSRRDDIEFYRHAARRYGEPVLDLGGGSGRIAMPLAQDGARVWVLDANARMLAAGRDRAARTLSDAERARVTLAEADIRSFRLRRRFPLVIAPFNVLMHLYEPDEFAACFRCVRQHLAPGGRFIFDVRMPIPSELARNPDRVYRGRPFRHPTLGHGVEYTERFRYDAVKQVQHVIMRFAPGAGAPRGSRARETLLTQRQIFPNELRALLALGGLHLRARHGDFSGRPLSDDAFVQVIEAATSEIKARRR